MGLPDDDGYERQNVRLNVDTRFGDLDIAASGFYSRANQDDKAVANSAFSQLTFASPAVDLTQIDPTDGYPLIDADTQSISSNPLYLLAVVDSRDKRTRTMGSVDLNYSPAGIDWLTLEANASFDRTDFYDYTLFPKNEKTREGPTGGSLREYNYTDEAINASVTLGASETFMDGDLTARGKVRYLIEDQAFGSNGVFGSQFSVQDVPNFGAIIGATSGNNQVRQIKAEGLFGIASVDYRGRYILDGLDPPGRLLAVRAGRALADVLPRLGRVADRAGGLLEHRRDRRVQAALLARNGGRAAELLRPVRDVRYLGRRDLPDQPREHGAEAGIHDRARGGDELRVLRQSGPRPDVRVADRRTTSCSGFHSRRSWASPASGRTRARSRRRRTRLRSATRRSTRRTWASSSG